MSNTIIMYNERRYQALHTDNTDMQFYTFTILHLRMCLVSLTLIWLDSPENGGFLLSFPHCVCTFVTTGIKIRKYEKLETQSGSWLGLATLFLICCNQWSPCREHCWVRVCVFTCILFIYFLRRKKSSRPTLRMFLPLIKPDKSVQRKKKKNLTAGN